MAGSSVTFTYDQGVDGGGYRDNVRKVVVNWTSDSSAGTASGTSEKIVGRLIKAIRVPGAAGAAPSGSYSISIKESNGNDVLANSESTLASNGSASAVQETYFFELSAAVTPIALPFSPRVCDALTIAVSGAGNSKQGTLILYLEPLG